MTDEQQLRARIRTALDSKQQHQLDTLSMQLGLAQEHPLEWVEQLMREELAASTHDVQQYWLGECNCHGLLN